MQARTEVDNVITRRPCAHLPLATKASSAATVRYKIVGPLQQAWVADQTSSALLLCTLPVQRRRISCCPLGNECERRLIV